MKGQVSSQELGWARIGPRILPHRFAVGTGAAGPNARILRF